MLNGRQLRHRTGEVLFVDLRRWDENTEEYVIDKGKKKKKTVLTDSQIAAVKKKHQQAFFAIVVLAPLNFSFPIECAPFRY